MSKRNRTRRVAEIEAIDLTGTPEENPVVADSLAPARKRALWIGAGTAIVLLMGLGVFAANGWLPSTDPNTGKKTGWFGKPLPMNATSTWNPLAPPPTPQLSKELIYAGSRLLAVEDANANAAPPADLAVWRPSNGTWYVLGASGQTYYSWGSTGDVPAPGDYDGDGKTDFCVFRPSTGQWIVVYSSSGSFDYLGFGQSGDKPIPADYDGDGKTDLAIWRPSTYTFYILKSSDSSSWYVTWGATGDHPASADYDGDGKADFAVWRDSTNSFYTLFSANGYTTYSTTSMGSITSNCTTGAKCVVSADYDGDGKANYAIRAGAGWVIMNAALTATSTTTPSGDASSDIPVENDYDADGKVDIAVWRGIDSPSGTLGHWYIRKSGSGGALRNESWGTTGDIPVPSYYRR